MYQKLTNHPKWFCIDRDTKVCNVVFFLKQNGVLSNTYQYDVMNEIVPWKDGVIRKAVFCYRNHQENIDRYITRAVYDLVLLHPIDQLNLIE